MPSMTNTSSTSGGSSQADMREASPEADPSNSAPSMVYYEHSPSRPPPPRTYNVQSTADGDVVVVEPSFDDGEQQQPPSSSGSNWQQARSPDDKARSPAKRVRASHARNLSAHFFDATKISGDASECGEAPRFSQMGGIKHDVQSPAVGQKHRRMFSGDVSNPPLAHRRINSIGNAAAVARRYPQPRGKHHQREDSAGLDILSAAVDASKDELAAAAGAPGPWEPPTPTTEYGQQYPPPPSTTMAAPAPPGSDVPGPMKPPPSRAAYLAPPVHGVPPVQHYVHHSSLPPPTVHYHHPPPYPPTGYYAPPPPPQAPTSRPVRYPVQYAHPPPPPPSYAYNAPTSYSVPPTVGEAPPANPPGTPAPGEEKIESDEQLFARKSYGTQGVQTFVTAISVGDGTRTLQPSTAGNEQPLAPISANYHHRKLSSFSSLGGFMGSSIFSSSNPAADSDHPLKGGHHRATSSTISFLQGLDVLEGSDVNFLRNLHSSTPSYGGAPLASDYEGQEAEASSEFCKLASGGTSKRVRRKCGIEGCPNRVVQGGLCISHGAKRKTCKHPGCNKNVKKAGFCSTHGPARKRCEAEGCTKVAVQGGRCIAHGAKKKLCSVENCKKQAILSGMCKKHHDKANGISTGRNKSIQAMDGAAKPTHNRGLSIFQDLTADAVSDLLADEDSVYMG